jgi:hypothetical protein
MEGLNAAEKAIMEIQRKDKIQDISKDHVMTHENLFIISKDQSAGD